MNAIKYFFFATLLSVVITSCKTSANLGDYSRESIDSIILAQDYRFVPTTALPTQMRTVNLSYSFYLKVTPTEVSSYLPYFGRAYSAPINPSEGGIQFTSKDFSYKIEEKKNKSYEITIETKDTPKRTKLYISTSDSGYASVRAIDENRQAISFNGRIEYNDKE